MPVKVNLVLREAKPKDPRQPPDAKGAPVPPMKVREAPDAARGTRPRAASVEAFLCDRKEGR